MDNNINYKNKSYKRAAGLFHTRDQAEAAVRALKNAGYDMEQVSIIARDADKINRDDRDRTNRNEETKEVGNKADDGAATGATTGGVIGGVTGLLVGLGTLAIPGIGPILLAGEVATAIATTLAGVGIGAVGGGLIGALIGLGIPEEKAKVYEEHIKGGSFLVIVDGVRAEIANAEKIMNNHNAQEFGIYDIPGKEATNVNDVDEDIRKRNDLGDDEKIRLYEERLIVNKQRQKTGEVAIGKEVKTETAETTIPVEKESVIIERHSTPDEKVTRENPTDFGNKDVARVEVYEEKANIDKQTFVREEVDVHKEVDRENVHSQEKLRHEELDIKGDADVVEHKR